MTNSKQFHYEAGRIYRQATAKTSEADKAMAKARIYEKAGDANRAEAEINNANKLYEQALQLEKTAIKYDNDAAELEAQALELESQASKLQQMFSYQIERLEHRQKMLRGQI